MELQPSRPFTPTLGIHVQKWYLLWALRSIVHLKQIKYGVCGVLILIYPKPYSIYLRGTIWIVPTWGYVVAERISGQQVLGPPVTSQGLQQNRRRKKKQTELIIIGGCIKIRRTFHLHTCMLSTFRTLHGPLPRLAAQLLDVKDLGPE